MTAPDQTNAEVSDERLREIVAGCEGRVTPGPWEVIEPRTSAPFAVQNAEIGEPGVARHIWAEPNAAHIARLDPDTVKALATELLNRRSVTSQASEGEVAWPEWATDKHIAEGILAEAETIVQLIIHGHEEQIAEHTGAIKSYAGTLLSRENHRHKYASPSKRVERLETALTEIIAGVETIGPAPTHDAHGDRKRLLWAVGNIARIARQALGGRS